LNRTTLVLVLALEIMVMVAILRVRGSRRQRTSRTGRRCGDLLFSKFILANCGSADDGAGAAAAQRATGSRLIDPRRPIAPNGSTQCFRSESPRRRNGAAAPRADLQEKRPSSNVKNAMRCRTTPTGAYWHISD